MPLAFSPFGYYIIAFISTAVLFWLCCKLKPKDGFIAGYAYGFALFGIGVNWLHISINLFGGVNLAGALFCTYLLVAFLALYPALCVWLAVRYFDKLSLFAMPSLWVLTEWLRGWLLTGFPWLNLGASQTDSWLANYAPLSGVYGITFAIAIIASSVVIVMNGNSRKKVMAVVAAGLLIGVGWQMKGKEWTTATGEELEVALIQGAIPQEMKWRREQRQPTLEIYTSLSKPYRKADLVIWPETAIPSLYHLADDFIGRIEQELAGDGTVFLSGIAFKDNASGKYFNSILLIDEKHRFYHKNQLVPFGEYMPFYAVLGGLLRFLKIPMSDFSAGDADDKILLTDKAKLGMSICYEDAYGEQIRKSMPDANLFINVSNDAWFGDSLAPHQHLQIARMRAIENGRYLLRSTNTGVSAIINQRGKIVSRSPQFEQHALAGKARLYKGATPYSRLGNIPVLIIAAGLLLLLYYLDRKQDKQ